jgi:hypothetical protein
MRGRFGREREPVSGALPNCSLSLEAARSKSFPMAIFAPRGRVREGGALPLPSLPMVGDPLLSRAHPEGVLRVVCYMLHDWK